MLIIPRKPATTGEILTEEFLSPDALTQAALADAMGVPANSADTAAPSPPQPAPIPAPPLR